MLRITQIEEIANLLLLLPNIVQEQERRTAEFVPKVEGWLILLEKVFRSNRLYQAGNIATLRSGLIAVKQGQIPEGIEFRDHPSRSRVMNAAASRALQRATDVVSTVIGENQPRIAEAERIAQQIVSVALSGGLITPRDEEMSNTQHLRTIRRSLAMSGELENVVVHLEGLVGPHDALILFDRFLTPMVKSS